jgi:hypothetical protein
VTSNEIVDLLFRDGVKVLELVHRRELGDVETVGCNTVRLTLEEMLRLVRRDVRNGGEDVGAVRRGPLDAVPVVDTTLARLVIDVKEGEVVVEVDGTGAEVTTEEGGVGGEDGRNVNVTLPAEGNTETSLPLVEVGDDGLRTLASRELQTYEEEQSISLFLVEKWRTGTHLSQEPSRQVSQQDRLVRLRVVWGRRNARQVPQVSLPFVKTVPHRSGVEEEDLGSALDEPSTIEELDAAVAHRGEGADEGGVGGVGGTGGTVCS